MITICDFEDSFTYNIFSQYQILAPNLKIRIIEKSNILKFLTESEKSSKKQIIVLGPGPGHPIQYEYLSAQVRKILDQKNIFMVGICLGHQIIAQSLGAKIKYCHEPVHGRALRYKLKGEFKRLWGENIEVQNYNSLAVEAKTLKNDHYETFANEEELIILKGERLLSYQFHPESIGTVDISAFFKPSLQFLL